MVWLPQCRSESRHRDALERAGVFGVKKWNESTQELKRAAS